MSDKITIGGPGAHRLVIPSSFLAKIAPLRIGTVPSSTTIVELHLAPGHWLTQAKANADAAAGGGAQGAVIDLLLGIAGTLDGLDTSSGHVTPSVRYATLTPMLGNRSSTATSVRLVANLQGDQPAVLSNIVISGTKHDELILLDL